MDFREYNPEQDKNAVHRMWMEVGWAEEADLPGLDIFLEAGRVLVADVQGFPECGVLTVPGTIRYLEEDLPFSVVEGVITSRIARKQHLARRLTAKAVADDAEKGSIVSGLGMFEQGFYNTLGYGTGPYEHSVSFDPAHLTVKVSHRIPNRITGDDWEAVHTSRLARFRGHGSCNVLPPQATRASLMERNKKAFGLGYFDGPNGELTHHFWARPDKVEHGPYRIEWMAWQTPEQFLELLALIKSLGDQVHLVRMNEPPGIQMQDFLCQPLKHRKVSHHSKWESGIRARAHWQIRICDLPGCMACTHLPGSTFRFNLILDDPIQSFLDEESLWQGISGEYVITLGQESSAVLGTNSSLPTLSASVGAFSRMWLGVRPASGLAVTDELSAPPELLKALDRALLLPEPHLDWDI